MKNRIWSFGLLLAVPFGVSSVRLAAQNPCFTYSSNYASYESAGITDVSSDGTTATLYTSVTVEGYGSMTIRGGNGCSGIDYSRIVHTPLAVNSIVGPGVSIGSGVYGNADCPACYISAVNNQSVPNIPPGTEYTFNFTTQVNCSMGGAIYGIIDFWTLARSINTYSRTSTNLDGTAEYDLNCPNGNAAAICGLQMGDHYHGVASYAWAEMLLLREVKHGITYCYRYTPVLLMNTWPAPFACR